MRHVEGDVVVVGQLVARTDRAACLDEHAVATTVLAFGFLQHGLGVRAAAEVDPLGDIAVVAAIDHPVFVQREQEGVTGLGVPGVVSIDIFVRSAQALVFDDAFAPFDVLAGKDAGAMDVGAACDDLARHAVLPEGVRAFSPGTFDRCHAWDTQCRTPALGLARFNPYNSGPD